jgi:FkbM family methyltransferase
MGLEIGRLSHAEKQNHTVSLVALATATACLAAFFVLHQEKMYSNYRCWKAAPSWQHCRSAAQFDFTTDFFGFRYAGNTKNGIDRQVLLLGAYEKPNLFFLRDTMQRIAPNGEGVFIDVGANNGHHSIFMSRYVREVHAFEPFPPVVTRFRHLIGLNEIKNIRVYPIALGDKPGKMPFYEDPNQDDTTGSFLKGWGSHTVYKELDIAVGDKILEDLPRVDLIKIDVEGYEKPVLRGLVQTLTKYRPVVEFELSMKCSNRQMEFKSMEELKAAFPQGYNLLTFDRDKSNPFKGNYAIKPLAQIDSTPECVRDAIAYPVEKEASIPR